MMRARRITVGLALLGVTSVASAQPVTLNFDELGPCTGTALTTYAGWLSLAGGSQCQTGSYSWLLHPKSGTNFLKTPGNTGWSFIGGPVAFNGMYVSGYGGFYLSLLNGGTTVHNQMFLTYGSPVLVSPAYGGDVDEVKITFLSGYSMLGIDDISFTPTADPVEELVNEANANPEPATLLLVASGLGGIGAMARRRRNKSAA